MRPTTSTTSSPAFMTFDTASLALSSSPIATKNHCSTKGSSAACLVKNRTILPSDLSCIGIYPWPDGDFAQLNTSSVARFPASMELQFTWALLVDCELAAYLHLPAL